MQFTNSLLPTAAGKLVRIAAVAALALSCAQAAEARAPHRGHGVAHELKVASKAQVRADHALVKAARQYRACVRSHSRHCASRHRTLQSAGTRLSRAQRHVRKLASRRGHGDKLNANQRAPELSRSGTSIRWSRVRGVASYVVLRQVPDQTADYTVTSHTSMTPPAVPGVTVRYKVRTNVAGSQWSQTVSISYPAVHAPDPAPPTNPAPPTPPTPPVTAPSVTVSGTTLSWNKVGDVTTYIVRSSVSGNADLFTSVSGTSVTPNAVAGKTVVYSVRAAVDGSAWSVPVSITYPQPPPAPSPPSGNPVGMVIGVNAGNYGRDGVAVDKDIAPYVRLDDELGGSAISMYGNLGEKIDLTFTGPYNSGGVAAINASSWVSQKLSFYKANTDPGKTPFVEILNEPGGSWFWGQNASSQRNADAYRNLVHQTYDAFHAAYGASAPKILATVDGDNDEEFGKRWWTSDSAGFVDGVIVHPYGGTGNRANSALGDRAAVQDAHTFTGKPVYVTEVGWPTAVGLAPTGDSLQWTEAEQATNITGFMDWARGTGYVAEVMYFGDRDYGTNSLYGVMRPDGSHKLGYAALKAEAYR